MLHSDTLDDVELDLIEEPSPVETVQTFPKQPPAQPQPKQLAAQPQPKQLPVQPQPTQQVPEPVPQAVPQLVPEAVPKQQPAPMPQQQSMPQCQPASSSGPPKVCKYFMFGHCSRGDSCQMKHVKLEDQPQAAAEAATVCGSTAAAAAAVAAATLSDDVGIPLAYKAVAAESAQLSQAFNVPAAFLPRAMMAAAAAAAGAPTGAACPQQSAAQLQPQSEAELALALPQAQSQLQAQPQPQSVVVPEGALPVGPLPAGPLPVGLVGAAEDSNSGAAVPAPAAQPPARPQVGHFSHALNVKLWTFFLSPACCYQCASTSINLQSFPFLLDMHDLHCLAFLLSNLC